MRASLSTTKFLFVLMPLVALIATPLPARANSAPPPFELWLVFPQPSNNRAVQLLECADAACAQTKLIADNANTAPARMACNETLCLFNSYRQTSSGIYKLVAADGATTKASPPFAIDMFGEYGYKRAFLVANDASGLVVSPTDIPRGVFSQPMLSGFLLTLAIELVVCAILFLVMKPRAAKLWHALVSVALLNALSYPVVWTLFPALSPMHYPSEFSLGVVLLFFAFIALACAVAWRWAQGNAKVVAGIFTVLVLIAAVPCGFFSLFATSYGYHPPQLTGISPLSGLIASEIFAFVFEALGMWLLAKRGLALWQAALISLVCNLISWGVGALVLPMMV